MNRFPLAHRSATNLYGSWLHLERDSHEYLAMPGQRFIPHEVLPFTDDYARRHPFLGCEGMLIGITPWLSDYAFGGAATGFITGVRTMRLTNKSRNLSHQVEILGRPTMWSAAGHFERLS